MKKSTAFSKMWIFLLLLVTFVAGCGGDNGGVPSTSAKATTAFSLSGSTGTVDESAKTITVTMPYGTDVTAQVATFTTTGSGVKVGTVAQTSGTTPNDFTSPVKYTVTATDNTTATYTVTVNVALITEKAITSYSLAGFPGTVNETTKTIAVTVPFGTDVKALVATFTTTGTLTQKSGTTPNDFTGPVTYTVTDGNGNSVSYTVTVTVASITAKSITAYSLAGVAGTINETAKTIAVTVPNGTILTNLVATFTSIGTGVKVVAVAQTSGTTANNFTAPVVYTVTAADNTTVTYTVTVTVAQTTAKSITAYSLAGIAGSINETAKTIAVTVPSGTILTNLVATFTTTGTGVKAGTAALVQTSGATPNNFTAPVVYTVTAADNTTAAYTVTVAVAPTTSKSITAYSLAGIAGAINETAKTIAVTVPSGTNVTALVATFTSTGTGVKAGAAALVQTSGATPNNFTNPVAYTVTAADGTTATYTVAVAFAVANPTAPNLGEAGRFVLLASQAVTTTGTTAISNGDIGLIDIQRSGMAGFTATGPAGNFTQLSNGTSFAFDDANPAPFPTPLHFATLPVGAPWATTGAMITQVRTDMGIANTFLSAATNPGAPTQLCPTELGARVLNRGVYLTASNVTITAGPLHLDAQGDPNAVFIFSTNGTLTTGPSGSIILDNGALAKNVYWRSAGITTIAAGTFFKGNVFAATQVNVLAGANVTGRLFAVTGQVTLIADTVTKAP